MPPAETQHPPGGVQGGRTTSDRPFPWLGGPALNEIDLLMINPRFQEWLAVHTRSAAEAAAETGIPTQYPS